MLRRLAFIAVSTMAVAAPLMAQEAGTVAGRPALSTTTTQDLISQREKWGGAPTATHAAPKADKATTAPSSYAVLPVGDVGKLISEREKWGKGPVKPAKAAKAAQKGKIEPPPPAKADKTINTPASYAVLPVGDVGKLISERETWGKGPAGYENKKVIAPPAAKAGPSKTKAKPKKAKPAKKKKNDE